jgi:hypothetical protein
MTRAGQRRTLWEEKKVRIIQSTSFNSLFVRLLLPPISADPEDLRLSSLLPRVVETVEDQHEVSLLRRRELNFKERNEQEREVKVRNQPESWQSPIESKRSSFLGNFIVSLMGIVTGEVTSAPSSSWSRSWDASR